jgi:uncharacterized protein (DUF736 family)
MSNIGKLTPANPLDPTDSDFEGHLRTLSLDLLIRTAPNHDKRSEHAPDLLMQALGASGQWVGVGSGWWKPVTRKDGSTGRYLSITIQDPSMPESLHCAAFQEDGTDNWLITWRPRKSSGRRTVVSGGSSQTSAA